MVLVVSHHFAPAHSFRVLLLSPLGFDSWTRTPNLWRGVALFTRTNPFCRSQAVFKDTTGPQLRLETFSEDHMLLDQTAAKCFCTTSPTKCDEDRGSGLCLLFRSARNSNAAIAKDVQQHRAPMVSCLLCHIVVPLPLHFPNEKKKVEIGPKSPVAAESLLSAQLASKYPVKLHLILSPALLQKEIPPHFLSVDMLYRGGIMVILHSHLKATASCHILCLMSRLSKLQLRMSSQKRLFQKTSLEFCPLLELTDCMTLISMSSFC